VMGLFVAVILKEPDFGMAVVIIASFLVIVFIAGFPWKLLAALSAAVAVGGALLILAKPYRVARIQAFHLNDSKKPCGSRVDRHEHIGKGCLGLEPFRLLLNDPRFAEHGMLLETPKLETPESRRRSDLDPWDARNLRTLRRLLVKA